jgi:hypothetical protein
MAALVPSRCAELGDRAEDNGRTVHERTWPVAVLICGVIERVARRAAGGPLNGRARRDAGPAAARSGAALIYIWRNSAVQRTSGG